MNPKTKSKAAFLAVLLVGVIAFSGCATTKKTGVERAETATAAMQDVSNDMRQASTQIDVTNAALNEVISVGQSAAAQPDDVKQAFEHYSQNVAKMEDVADTLFKDIAKMNSEANAYFEAWSKEGSTYTSPRIQILSEEERVQVRESFTDISSKSAGMRGNLNAYVSQIRQIQTYLSNNLTGEGISAIAATAQTAQTNGENVKSSFEPIQTAIAQTRVQMTPGAAAGGTEGTGDVSTPDSGAGQAPVPEQPQGTSPGGADTTTEHPYR